MSVVLVRLLPIVVAAFTVSGWPGAAEPTVDVANRASVPAGAAGDRVLRVLAHVEQRLQTTRYQHATVVRERDGVFHWDCSGMAAWVLRRAAPRAMAGVRRGRPVARDFFNAIDRAPVDRGLRGWQKLSHIEHARPGDVFAWLRPPAFAPRNTGHVGFIVEAPVPVPRAPHAYTVRITDATSLPHQSDSRAYEGEGGYGTGTILFLTDGQGQATAYGWFGTSSPGVIPTRIVFGRLAER